ncbi:MAG: alpha/beta fold hydrolase [Bacillota bacterium]|jgi:pimeloyl-ACP methyl ester carboxylesterase
MIKKTFDYVGMKVVYYEDGQGWPVVLLHGWGCSHETMQPVAAHLKDCFRIYNFDLPGHGESDEPKEPWGTVEYKEMLKAFFAEQQIQNPILIAHSFGGRLSIRLGAEEIPHKMVLTGCAGLKPKRGLDYYAKVYSYKAAKKALGLPGLRKKKEEILANMRNKKGSADYQQASEAMRGTFVRVVNEDLKDLLPKVNASTLLYWGENDTATPVDDGKIMEKNMRDAGLVIMKNSTHYAYLENLPNFLAVVDSFLKPEARK